MNTVQIYQMTVQSFLPLPGQQALGKTPDVEIVLGRHDDRRPFPLSPTSRIYWKPERSDGSPSEVEFHRHGKWHCLCYPATVEFYFCETGRVVCFPHPQADLELVRSLILGPLSAVLLELQGTVCLHASAVRVGEVVVALAGPSGVGKSTLTAWFVQQGRALVTDDILALQTRGDSCLAVPGFPQLKLAADSLDQIGGTARGQCLSAVGHKRCLRVGQGWGAFATEPLPLEIVYLLQRDPVADAGGPSRVRILPVAPRENLVELVRFSFCGQLAATLGMSPIRFGKLAETANRVAVRRLCYSDGLSSLEEVHQAVCDDVAQTLRRPIISSTPLSCPR